MDGGGDLERHQRMREKQRQERSVRKGPSLAGERRIKQRLAALRFVDGDANTFAGLVQAKLVAAIGIDKGRDVEGLVRRLLPLGRQDIAVALAKGVVDLVDRRQRLPLGVVAKPDGERIEHIAQNARVAEQPDALGLRQALVPQL
nr:hypothetical protein [Devosia aurantiaca]